MRLLLLGLVIGLLSGCCTNTTGLSNKEIEVIESQDNYIPWWAR